MTGGANVSKLGRYWAGNVYGTNIGTLFAEFQNTEDGFTGILRILDNRFGLAIYDIKGNFERYIGSDRSRSVKYNRLPKCSARARRVRS